MKSELRLIAATIVSLSTATASTAPPTLQSLLAQKEVATALDKQVRTRAAVFTQAAFKNLADRASKAASPTEFLRPIINEKLGEADWKKLEEMTKGYGKLAVISREKGITFVFSGQKLELKTTSKLSEITLNGHPVKPQGLESGLDQAIKAEMAAASKGATNSTSLPSKFQFAHAFSTYAIPQSEAGLPLAVWAVWVLAKNVAVGAAAGAVAAGTVGVVMGCGLAIHDGSTDKTYGEKCVDGVKNGIDSTLVAGGAGVFGAVGLVPGLTTVWMGQEVYLGSTQRTAAEIAQLQKAIKLGGALTVLTAAYHTGKHVAEGYGVELHCYSNSEWTLNTLSGGKNMGTIATSAGPNYLGISKSPTSLESEYSKFLVERGVPESGRDALAQKLVAEHKERSEFCQKNPGKRDRVIFSAYKDVPRTSSQPTAK